MTSLVEELQREALNSSTPIPVLLRKVKLVASKLQLADVGDWVDGELNGYSGEVPDYRVRSGDVRWWNPYHGWLPVSGSEIVMERLREKRVGESVSALEAFSNSADDAFHIPVSHDLAARLFKDELLGTPKVAVFFGRNVFTDILDQVRTRVLEWALTLERAGIMGDGISFSPVEKAKAESVTISIGSMQGNFLAGDVTGHNARANLGSTDNSTNVVGDTLSQLSQAIGEKVANAQERDALLAAVDEMKGAKGKSSFAAGYQKLVAAAADHMTVITPFLPALAAAMANTG